MISKIQRFKGALCKIALLGSYRIFLARNSDSWQPGGFIEVGEQKKGRGDRLPATNPTSWTKTISTLIFYIFYFSMQRLDEILLFFTSNFLISYFVWQWFRWRAQAWCNDQRKFPIVRACGQFNQELALLGIHTPRKCIQPRCVSLLSFANKK